MYTAKRNRHIKNILVVIEKGKMARARYGYQVKK